MKSALLIDVFEPLITATDTVFTVPTDLTESIRKKITVFYHLCEMYLEFICRLHLWQVHVTRLLRPLKDGALENLWGDGRSTKKYSRKGKLNEKNSCTQINPKKYSCHVLKKIHTRNLITKKNSYGPKIPHPHHNFSNGPSQMKPLLYALCVIIYSM